MPAASVLSYFKAAQSSRQEVIRKPPSRGGGLASRQGRRAGLEESFFGDGQALEITAV